MRNTQQQQHTLVRASVYSRYQTEIERQHAQTFIQAQTSNNKLLGRQALALCLCVVCMALVGLFFHVLLLVQSDLVGGVV